MEHVNDKISAYLDCISQTKKTDKVQRAPTSTPQDEFKKVDFESESSVENYLQDLKVQTAADGITNKNNDADEDTLTAMNRLQENLTQDKGFKKIPLGNSNAIFRNLKTLRKDNCARSPNRPAKSSFFPSQANSQDNFKRISLDDDTAVASYLQSLRQ